jgi:hypothetical protein
MQLFIEEDNPLSWMLLESIELDDRRIDVHFNMGLEERDPFEFGIIKPLSFRVWSAGDDPQLLEIIDYEIALFDGEPSTAAICKTQGGMHLNFEMLPVNATYEEITSAALRAIKK